MPAANAISPHAQPGCELCASDAGLVVWRDADWRAVRVADADFPAFYRVISNRHVREFSELPDVDRQRCMGLVCAIERTLIARLQPTKVNLASLGNVVPHVHWHLIARFEWDSHFPQPIWGQRQRELALGEAERRLSAALPALDGLVARALAAV